MSQTRLQGLSRGAQAPPCFNVSLARSFARCTCGRAVIGFMTSETVWLRAQRVTPEPVRRRPGEPNEGSHTTRTPRRAASVGELPQEGRFAGPGFI